MAEHAQENPTDIVSKSNFFRVIQGSGMTIAASKEDVSIQIFSEYPKPDFLSQAEFRRDAPFSPKPTKNEIIREMEVCIKLSYASAKDLVQVLTKIFEAQAAEKGGSS